MAFLIIPLYRGTRRPQGRAYIAARPPLGEDYDILRFGTEAEAEDALRRLVFIEDEEGWVQGWTLPRPGIEVSTIITYGVPTRYRVITPEGEITLTLGTQGWTFPGLARDVGLAD